VETLTRRLYHTAPRTVEWVEERLVPPAAGEVLVRTTISAVSGGTEGLFFRGEVDESTRLDSQIPALAGTAGYPFRYGYCLCGVVEVLGEGVPRDWLGARVFAFEPHCERFVCAVSALQRVPDAVSDRRALFFPLVETAATLVLDARPQWQDRVAVFGLGPLGALTSGLLSRFPLQVLSLQDCLEERSRRVHSWLHRSPASTTEYDLAFDLGGTPQSAAAAVKSLGFGGRLVLGSWQGRDLLLPGVGPEFHRKRLEVVTSQVSTLSPSLTARWSLSRRSESVWSVLQDWAVDELISHEFAHRNAQEAFESLQHDKKTVYQVVFCYD